MQAFLVFNAPALKLATSDKYLCDALSSYSIFSRDEKTTNLRKAELTRKIREANLTAPENRAIGVLLGLAIGDALGAPFEFSDVRYNSTELSGFDQVAIWQDDRYNRFR